MKYYDGRFESHDGLELFKRVWEPEGARKGVVCMVHGLGEHSGRYEFSAAYFCRNGYTFTAFDLRGHGHSGGKKGDTPSFEFLMKDIADFLRNTSFNFPDLPVILYGHSLGGNLVLNYALRSNPPIKCVISTGPWLRLAYDPGRLNLILANIMNFVYPSFTKATGLKSADLSNVKQVGQQYQKDPLVHSLVSVRMFKCISEAGEWVLNNAGAMKLPLLLMHGGEDKITSCNASRVFADRLKCPYRFKIWSGLQHELHNEANREEVLDYVLDWIEKQQNI